MGTPGGKIGEAFMSWSKSRASTFARSMLLSVHVARMQARSAFRAVFC